MSRDQADPLREEPSAQPRFFDADRYTGVLEEIGRLQRKQSSWVGALVVLVISFVVYLALSGPSHSFASLWVLAPILLFHEFGHFAAMKAFRYRNLKMFFIPGFGAGVVGSHYNVPGWKRAIVALMGPLPGIIVGILIGIVGVLSQKQAVIHVGHLVVLINGFNLIPIFPLDGGHVAHVLLFSRHPVLDVFFRAITAVGIMTLGAFGQSYLLLGIGVFSVLALPVTLRIARAARTLRTLGVDPVSDDDQSIPRPVAEMIIDELREKAPAPMADKVLAEQTLNVFETLNARPPGVVGTIGVSLLYILSFVAAILFVFVFTLAQRGSLGNLARTMGQRPQNAIVVADIRQTPPISPQPGPSVSVVATFKSPEAASAAYAAQARPGQSASLFGSTLFVQVPADDEKARADLLASLQPIAKDVFVDGPELKAVFRVHTVAPTLEVAENIKTVLTEYFNLPLSEPCIPPWVTTAPLTDSQRLARSTYARVLSVSTYSRPEVEALINEISEARRKGDSAAVKAKTAQIRELTRSLRDAALNDIASGSGGPADADLVREYIDLTSKSEDSELTPEAEKKLAPRFGLTPPAPSPESAQCAASGYCHSADLIVQINFLRFTSADAGFPALLNWLHSLGCDSFYYEVEGLSNADEESDY